MAKIEKIGYGQVELNKVAATRTKQIFGQLPASEELALVENGMGLVYDHVAGEVRLPKKGELVGLHNSEIILPDERKQHDRDFALIASRANQLQVAMAVHPRIYALTLGDTFTTNVVDTDKEELSVGDKFTSGAEGYWVEADGSEDLVLSVLKDYTMPDGQRGIKFVVTSVGAAKVGGEE